MAELSSRTYEVHIDMETGLYDRRTMWSRLAEEADRARRYHYPLSLMLLSFATDDPAQVTEGVHHLADVLKQHTRTADILARYSEDTLAMLLPCTNEQGALLMADRIRRVARSTLPTRLRVQGDVPLCIGLTSTAGNSYGDKVDLVEQLEWAMRRSAQKDKTVINPATTEPAAAK